MTKEWQAKCKHEGCNNLVGYSDRSYRNSLQYGFSRPEYCPEHEEEQHKMRKGMGSPYFHVSRVIGEIKPGPLGYIKRSEKRVHTSTENLGSFDENRFGVTPDKIYEIAEWFSDPNHRVAVVVGPTGSGKSTAVPYWLVYPPKKVVEDFGENFFTRDGQILVTLPRIAALKGIAKFVGVNLMGSSHIGKGYDVGYSYSEDRNTDWRNVLIPQTDGQFINSIISGRISQYGIVVIDEAHERSENIEAILRLLRDRMALYPNLKVIIASATIDKEAFRKFFEDQGAKVVELEGKRVDKDGNPVSYQQYFADESERIEYEELAHLTKALPQAIKTKTEWLVNEIIADRKPIGDILIFLHSQSAITKVVDQLKAMVNQQEQLADIVGVYPFYRDLEEDQKEQILYKKPKKGHFRIIVSTNYAEASLTIDTLVYVIETGVEIRTEFKAELGMTEYPIALVSKANARQRWGRVGRTSNGEVYCLYTQDQFESDELFIPFPIPALERANMESLVLKAKAAGIPDVSEGWLGTPTQEEIDRSTEQLVQSNILTQAGTLTPYGVLVQAFSYPPKLIDVLMDADDLGCSVEIATLLPVIRNGGERRLLSWSYKWDAYTKRDAYRRHKALMSGSLDDVEFILKLFKAWSELPWLDPKKLKELSREELNTIRKQWAELHFVNHKAMLKIAEERNKALERLRVGTKSEDARIIELGQMQRVRSLLHSVLTEAEIVTPVSPYLYQSKIEPQTQTVATVQLIPNQQIQQTFDSWLEIPEASVESDGIFSRLFVDQVYPVGYRFEARVIDQLQGYVMVETTKNLTRAQDLMQQSVNLVEEDEDSEETLTDGDQEDIEEPETVKGISLSDFVPQYHLISCQQAIQTSSALPNTVIVEIVDYYYGGNKPLVVVSVVPQPEPFDVFVKRHRYSDELTVQVSDVIQFEGDYSAALAVFDVDTNLEVLVEPQDLSFTRLAQAVTRIGKGTRLTLNIENIDTERRRVRLSNWERVETAITDRFVTTEGDDETTVAPAEVAEVRDDSKVMFIVNLDQTSPDICVVTSAYGKKLPEGQKFNQGDLVTLKVYRRSRSTKYAPLSKLPQKVQSKVGTEDRPGELSCSRGTLRFTGRMTYDRLYELKTYADRDIEYQKALELLYWLSNQVYVAQFIDTELFNRMQTVLAVGTVINNAVVVDKNAGGVNVELGRGLKGFVPKSKILDGSRDLIDLISIGSTVQVRVLEHRIDQGEPLLEIIGGITDPLDQIVIGKTYKGIIEEVNEKGVFVILASSIRSRVRHGEIYKGGVKTEELFKAGDQILVKVLSIDKPSRFIELSMKIPEYDPTAKLKQDAVVEGVVASQQNYGYFVTIAPGIDGLMRHADIPEVSTGFLGLGGKSKPTITIGMRLLVKITSVGPDRKNPNKTAYALEYVKTLK